MALSILDIKRTVSKRLKEAFPECNIYSDRVEQNMKAPAFHLDIIPYDAPKVSKYGYHVHYFVNCTYFPIKEGESDDNLQAWDRWREAFYEPLTLLQSGEVVLPQEQSCVVLESLYRFNFNIEEVYYKTPDYSDIDRITTVHLN